MNKKTGPFSKRAKYGAFSAVTTFLVLAALVAVNVVAGRLNVKFDLTRDKVYEITEDTTDVLSRLSEDVTIYTLFRAGTDTDADVTRVTEITRQYAGASNHIRVENKDPYVNRAFVAQYGNDAQVPVNSLVVVSNRRAKVISSGGFYTAVTNNKTGEDELQVEIEPKLTNAIVYVTQSETDVAYVMTGHQESGLSETMRGYLEEANYAVSEYNPLAAAAIPPDCAVLILTPPATDYSAADAEKVSEYLRNDGRVLMFGDYSPVPLKNYNAVLETYGAAFQNVCVYEGNSALALPQSSQLILPAPARHDITSAMRESGTPVLLFQSAAIERSAGKRPSVVMDDLLTTSAQAFGKSRPDSVSQNKEPGDASGPFTIAVAISDAYDVGTVNHYTKLVAIGGASLLEDELDAYVSGGNSAFVVRALNWLSDREEDALVYVRPKYLAEQTPLALTGLSAIGLKLFSMALLPACIFIIGALIWLRRRNK